MAEWRSRKPLEFRISNRTYNTTLKNPRTDNNENSPRRLTPVLLSGSSNSGHLLSSSNALGHGWLVIYEAESFTLAIFFFLSERPGTTPNILQLEVSLDKAHLGDFRETFARMTLVQHPPNPEKTVGSCARFSGQGQVTVMLHTGPYEVMASASRYPNPLLEVELGQRVIDPLGPI